MKQYAVLNSSNLVENIIVSYNLENAERVTGAYCVAIPHGTSVNIGDLYNGETFSASGE